MKKRFLSMLIVFSMLCMLMPQSIAFAAVSVEEIDAAIKEIGGLADKGNIYVAGNILPESVEINGEEYALSYTSDKPEVIGSTGAVTHTSNPVCVTVTPQITDNGETVSGAAQRIIVLPHAELMTEALFEDFENFDEGSLIGKEESALHGWSLNSYCDSNYVNADIVNDSAQSKYLKFELYKKGLAQNPQMTKSFSSSDTGKTIISMRLNLSPWTNAPNKNVYIFPLAEFDWYGAMYGRDNQKSSGIFTVRTWQEFMFVIDNDNVETVDGNVFKKADVYVDGVLKAEDYPLQGWNDALTLRIFRNNVSDTESQYIYMDDVLIYGLDKEKLPDIKLADKGNTYVSGNKLPETVNIEGTDYPVTYVSDNEAVIAPDGTVTHNKSYTYVTVTPTAEVDGETLEGTKRKLLVLPSEYDELLFEGFEGFSEGTMPKNATTNGWTSNNYSGETHIRQEIKSDAAHGKFLHLGAESPENMGSVNPVITKAFNGAAGYEGTTLIGMKLLASPSRSSNGFNITMLGQFNYGNIKGGNGTELSVSGYTGSWHDFLFVINNEDTITTDGNLYKKAKVYMDGEEKGSFYTNNWSDQFQMMLYRGYDQYAQIDDIFALNVTGLITKSPEIDNIRMANIGNSYVTENLPSSVKIEGEEYTVSYETSDTAVIKENGNIVQKDFEYGYAVVTPYIFLKDDNNDDVKVKGIRTALTVLPKNYTTVFSDDFEGVAPNTNLAMPVNMSGRYNGWYAHSSAMSQKVSFVTQEEEITKNKSNRFMSFVSEMPGGAVNPIVYNEVSFKEVGGTITAISMKLKYKNDLSLMLRGIGYIESGRIRNSSMVTLMTYSNTVLKPNNWYTLTFLKNGMTLNTKVYIDGVYQGEYTPEPTTDNLEMFQYRNYSTDAFIDDILIQRVTDIDNLKAVRDGLYIGDVDNITDNILLPATGKGNVAITWEKNCDDNVAEIKDGMLFVKRKTEEDQYFKLTATLVGNQTTLTREFNITLKGISALEEASLTFEQISNSQKENAVMNNLTLPESCDGGRINIAWSSLTPDAVNDEGELLKGLLDKKAEIQAVYTAAGKEPFTKVYSFIIRGTGEVLYESSFDEATQSGVSVDTISGWKIGGTEDKHEEKSVNSVIISDPRDALMQFEDARKVLNVNRFATKGERAVSNDKAMLSFDKTIKCERTSYDFDFMFMNDCRILVELFDMQMTFAITTSGVGQYGFDNRKISFDNQLKLGTWYHATIVQDGYSGKYDFYLDYTKVGSAISKGAKGIKGINFYSNAISSNNKDNFLIANILVKDVTPENEAAVKKAVADLTLGTVDYDRAKINLPESSSENTYVEWKSLQSDIISDKGVVNRSGNTETVTLIATVSKGEYSEEKRFDVNVASLTSPVTPTDAIMNVIKDDLTFDLISDESHLRITKDLNLITSLDFGKAREIGGVTISWVSDTPYIITNEGKYRESRYEAAVKLTATITSTANPSVKTTKEFLVVPQTKAVKFAYWDFEDTTPETVGETVQDWTTLTRRNFTSETEYGLRQYVDKEPGQEHLPLEKANKVLYLDRVVDGSLASIPYLDYLRFFIPEGEGRSTIEKAGNVAVSFKLMRESNDTSVKMTIICMSEQTTSISKDSFYRRSPAPDYTATFKTPMEAKKWYEITMFFDLQSHRMDVYVDGVRANDDAFDVPWGYNQLTEIRIFNDTMNPVYLDDYCIRYLTPENGENQVANDIEKLSIVSSATEDIVLPVTGEAGSSIYWESSNSDVITNGGKIFPSSVSDLSATLTACVRYNDVMQKRSFNVNVPRNPQVPYEIIDIAVENDMLKSVSVSQNSSRANAQLMVMIYNKGRLVGTKTFDVTASGEFLVNYDLSTLKNYKVTAFVWNKTEILSNKKSID